MLALVMLQPSTATAAPNKAQTTGAKTTRTQQASTASGKPARAANRKTASSTSASKKSTRTTRQRVAPACPKPAAKAATKGKRSKTTQGRKTPPAAGCKPGPSSTPPAAAAGGAAGGGAAAVAATPIQQEPERPGIRLPLMLRTVPSLPDNPEALQSRLDSIVAAQGASAQGAQVSGVRQLAPDIYAFSLQCADAEQCQRLRLAIEREIDWVAGLQLDERRHLPPPPERSAPAAR